MTHHASTGAGAAVARVHAAIETEKQAFIDKKDGQKRAGYLCNYAPLELFSAAGLRFIRLFQAGDPKTVALGERFTQSVYCDFSKSCLGSFAGGDPLYTALDKVYNVHTCNTTKRVTEIIDQFVPTKLMSLPKFRDIPTSRKFFLGEVLDLKKDLETLTGKTISEEVIHDRIMLYNKLRRLLKAISELRRREHPPITGGQYLDLVKAYYYLEPEQSLDIYQQILADLTDTAPKRSRPLRLMVAGSIVADGDRRLLDIVEGDLGTRVVVEDHCTGVRPFSHIIDEDGDPLQALADGYLDQAPCARMKPLSDSAEFAGRLAQDYAVDGVLYVYLKFCTCHGLATKEFTSHLKTLGLPVLEISGDYSQSDHGQLQTRLEAFIEVLTERKDAADEQYVTA